jgi:hypothetical protein
MLSSYTQITLTGISTAWTFFLSLVTENANKPYLKLLRENVELIVILFVWRVFKFNDVKNNCFLGYDAVLSGRILLTFRENVLPSLRRDGGNTYLWNAENFYIPSRTLHSLRRENLKFHFMALNWRSSDMLINLEIWNRVRLSRHKTFILKLVLLSYSRNRLRCVN